MYIHIWKCQAPGGSPWSVAMEVSGYIFPSSFPKQIILRGSSVGWSLGCFSGDQLCRIRLNWLSLHTCSTLPSPPLLSPGITSQNKLLPHMLPSYTLCFGKTWAREAWMPLQLELCPSKVPSTKVRWICFLYHSISCYSHGMLYFDYVEIWLYCNSFFVFCLSFFLVDEADAFFTASLIPSKCSVALFVMCSNMCHFPWGPVVLPSSGVFVSFSPGILLFLEFPIFFPLYFFSFCFTIFLMNFL